MVILPLSSLFSVFQLLVLLIIKCSSTDLKKVIARSSDSDQTKEESELPFFCTTCEIAIHDHTKHCRVCDQCMAHFDHHCYWLDNCIGSTNYPYFIVFLSLTLLKTLLTLTTSLVCLYTISTSSVRLYYAILPILVSLLSALILLFILPLSCFHVFLILRRETTFEYITRRRKANKNKKARLSTPQKMNKVNPHHKKQILGRARASQSTDPSESTEAIGNPEQTHHH